MRIVRVTRDEFEVDDGSVYPITPPLEKDMTPDEFQAHYDYASAVIGRSPQAGPDAEDAATDGPSRKD